MKDALSRRNFLGAAAGATLPMMLTTAGLRAAPLLSGPAPAYSPDASLQKVKVGFIGVGGRGNALLGDVLKSQQAELVAICDIRPEAVEMAKLRCVGMSPKGYANYLDLLADDAVEAVVIATPVDLHRDMAIAAVNADKHVYCEKPLGVNAAEAEAVHAAASRSPRVFQVGFQWVYNRNFRAAVEAIHDNAIGGVRFVNFARHGGDLPRDKGKDWLFQRRRSGDIIVEQAVHEMNILCWMLKNAPTRATGFGGTNLYINEPAGRTIMDHYSLSYEFPGPVHANYSHLYYAGAKGTMFIHAFGSEGVVDVMGGQIFLPDGATTPEPRESSLTDEDTFNGFLAFFDKIRNGGKAEASSLKGLLATRMAILGRTAIYEGRPVTWGELDDPKTYTVAL